MKKKILALLLLLVFALATTSFAAGTIVQTSERLKDVNGAFNKVVVTLTCTGDAANGSFPTTGGAIINPTTLNIKGWYLRSIETNPGSTAPTALYDVTLLSASGRDKAGGLLANRSATVTEEVFLASVGEPQILENWTWTMINNVVASATVVAKLIFVLE